MSFCYDIKVPIFMPKKTKKITVKLKIRNRDKIKRIIDEMPHNGLVNGFHVERGKGNRLIYSDLVTLYLVVKESLPKQNALYSVEPADGEILIFLDD